MIRNFKHQNIYNINITNTDKNINMTKTAKQQRNIRYLQRDNAKLRKELEKIKRNQLMCQKMTMKASKLAIKKIQTAEAETNIFRKSMKNFATTCYAQKKEIKKLLAYIRRKRREKNTIRARRNALKTRVNA